MDPLLACIKGPKEQWKAAIMRAIDWRLLKGDPNTDNATINLPPGDAEFDDNNPYIIERHYHSRLQMYLKMLNMQRMVAMVPSNGATFP